MGWTSFYVDGKVDRKEECRREFSKYPEWATILKDAMVGTTYYAAMKMTATEEVFCLVVLTSIRDGQFFYKDMTDTMGPSECHCPVGIIKLLTPTDSQYANEWRQDCIDNAKAKANTTKKEAYYIATKDGFVERFGKKECFYSTEEFPVDVYVERRGNGVWYATESTSGLLVSEASTKASLLEKVKGYVDRIAKRIMDGDCDKWRNSLKEFKAAL